MRVLHQLPNPTHEQRAILDTEGNLTINAVAGSGKTTTLLMIAAARATQRLLYVAFNRSVKVTAQERFQALGFTHVRVETAHSLAYPICFTHGYRVRQNGYSPTELAAILSLGSSATSLSIARHVLQWTAFFCNSRMEKVAETDYLSTLSNTESKVFVAHHFTLIEDATRRFLAKMNSGEIEVTHDFYLKKFQLSRPILPYDVILFDEGQDASEAMLELFLMQPSVKIIVGDTHQQIYSFRYAINSLEKAGFPILPLSESFRFGEGIALKARAVLMWKSLLGKRFEARLVGRGKPKSIETKATLARTNTSLLVAAIEQFSRSKSDASFFFEGGFDRYIYGEEGGSLYDVLNLYVGRRSHIKDPLLMQFSSFSELEQYASLTEDGGLISLIDIVRKYDKDLPRLLKGLRKNALPAGERQNASTIFTTVHRAKGMEYDAVTLCDDFITETKIKQTLAAAQQVNETPSPMLHARRRGAMTESIEDYRKRLNEEINLLYVALTRATSVVYLPERLDSLLPSQTKRVTKTATDGGTRTPPTYPLKNSRANLLWQETEDAALLADYMNGLDIIELSKRYGRTPAAIVSRLKRLNALTD